HTRILDRDWTAFCQPARTGPRSKPFLKGEAKLRKIRQRKWLGKRLQLQEFPGCFARDDLAILRVHGSASKFRYCQSGARAQPFPVLRLVGPFAQPQCWPAERRSTKRTIFRQGRRAVAGKDFPSAPCSILLVLPTRRRLLHPCNALAPV